MRFDRAIFPRLSHVLGSLYPYCEAGVIDQDAMPEGVVCRWSDEVMEEFREESARALEALSGRDLESGVEWLGLQIALPGGSTAHTWFRDLSMHLDEYHRDGSPPVISTDGSQLPRVTTFPDEATANAASTAVLRAHESTVRAWSDDPGSTWRLHLYADLGEQVGEELRREEVEASHAGSAPPEKHPVQGCVVLLRKDPETRQPFVAVTYADISLPTEARERFPDLPLLFGGYFGQDYAELDRDRWAAERNLNFSTPPAVKDRMASQLADLLTQDDDTLRRDVEALGSYVLPDAMRRWVTGLHRRMTRIDWSRR